MTAPKKWWWVVDIAVPLALALIAIAPDLIDRVRSKPDSVPLSSGVVVHGGQISGSEFVGGDKFEGDRIHNQAAFTSWTLLVGATASSLPEERRVLLRRAQDWIEAGDYDKAIPILEAVGETAPSAALLNNLAAAHLALGRTAAAEAALSEAEQAGPADAEVDVALRFNRRRLAAETTPVLPGLSAPVPTDWPGLFARLIRFEDTGGLVTVEVAFENRSAKTISFCVHPSKGYLIEERSGESWQPSFSRYVNCNLSLQPGAAWTGWIKLPTTPDGKGSYTIVFPGLSRPFEKLRLVPSP